MRLAILGTGALARYYAYQLRSAQPIVVGRALSTYQVRGDGFESTVTPRFLPWTHNPGPIDVVLILVKWPAMPLVREWLARYGGNALVISLMNGMGQEDIFASVTNPDRLAMGVTTAACTRIDTPEPAVIVRHVGEEVLPITGHAAEGSLKEMTLARNLGWRWLPPAQLQSMRWRKLLFNSVINPLSALANCVNRELPALPIWQLASPLLAEGLQVARAAGIPLADHRELLAEAAALAQTTGDNLSSMLQDVRAGRPTEILAINGYIVRMGRQNGLDTPVQHALVRLIESITGQSP
ncbi:MAG: 2-dehydropantoate 2-reductase [Thermaerobacter sp.]|nr:2-dehydropantoate 2-reductase [Thermaerobacter sp.]